MTYRVIQWGTGNVGRHALRTIVGRPSLELVGVRVYNPDKVGIDAGEIVAAPATGVQATDDVSAILALDADCVSYSARRRSSTRSRRSVPRRPGSDHRWIFRCGAAGTSTADPGHATSDSTARIDEMGTEVGSEQPEIPREDRGGDGEIDDQEDSAAG